MAKILGDAERKRPVNLSRSVRACQLNPSVLPKPQRGRLTFSGAFKNALQFPPVFDNSSQRQREQNNFISFFFFLFKHPPLAYLAGSNRRYTDKKRSLLSLQPSFLCSVTSLPSSNLKVSNLAFGRQAKVCVADGLQQEDGVGVMNA